MARIAARDEAALGVAADDVSRPAGSTNGEVEGIVREIGPKVKALRAELGMTLQQMSEVADVSAASIHKIERGDMVPTITTLLKLASAFRRPLSYFIDEQPGDPHDTWYTARGEGEVVDSEAGVTAVRVSGPRMRFRAEATVTRLDADSRLTEPGQRPGEALLFVTSGAVAAVVAGRSFELRRGGTLHYLTDRPISLSSLGKKAAELLRISLPYA
jgi:transcriptional regulator with XRE-family HTH domain